jgi:hypothetical protein
MKLGGIYSSLLDMFDPAALAAGTIAKLAFDEFAKTGAGEAAKATVAGAVELVKGLRERIRERLSGNPSAIDAVHEVEHGNSAALEIVEKYLDLKMKDEPSFGQDLRQIAQQIINMQNQASTSLHQQNYNYGHNQIIISNSRDIVIGGS